jgi:hypothetical protein
MGLQLTDDVVPLSSWFDVGYILLCVIFGSLQVGHCDENPVLNCGMSNVGIMTSTPDRKWNARVLVQDYDCSGNIFSR